MTTSELIAELQKYPKDMKVVTYGGERGEWYDLETIEPVKDCEIYRKDSNGVEILYLD